MNPVTIPFKYIGLMMLLMLSVSMSAQEELKNTYKDPVVDISIFYMDLMSKNIGFSDLAILEKSYHATSDKSYIHDKIIRSLIYEESSSDETANTVDTSFYMKIADCPKMGPYRPADPLLMVDGLFCYKVCNGDSNITLAYLSYLTWQSNTVPHSPIGKNSPPDNYNLTQKQKWLYNYTKDWVNQYPEEYHLMLRQFDSVFKKWIEINPNGSYIDFLRTHSKIVQHDYDNAIEMLLHISHSGFNSTVNIAQLPPDQTMKNKTREFIREAYENLYQRDPNDSEITFLEQFINTHKELTVKQFYYAMMTSDEYKYY